MTGGVPTRRLVRLACTAGALLLCSALGACGDPVGPVDGAYCAARPDTAVVSFEDPMLTLAVHSTLSVSLRADLTCGMVEGLTSLSAASMGIVSIEGIENMTGLTRLWIRGNEITDISPLRGLTGLTSLNLAANRIADVEPLRGLTGLTFLAINDNRSITDIEVLRGLTRLTGTLWIGGNAISDLRPLSSLQDLTGLHAWDNSITSLDGLGSLTNLAILSIHTNWITDVEALRDLAALSSIRLQSNPDLIDVQALIDNPGLGAGTSLNLSGTSVSCADVSALSAKGVAMISDCP